MKDSKLQEKPPALKTAQNKTLLCPFFFVDLDLDSYCQWGSGSKFKQPNSMQIHNNEKNRKQTAVKYCFKQYV
jgi:hypothetical protein